MPRVMLSLRQTSVDVLSTVSATASVVTSGVQSMANYADALEAHSEHYSATTRADLSLSSESFKLIARERAKLRIARAKQEINQELQDEELKALYDAIIFDDELPTSPELSIAAE